MKSLFALACAFLAAAGASHAQDEGGGDPVLGERLIDAAATTDRLWVLNNEGAVVAFDRVTGARIVLAQSGVVDLVRDNGRTIALRSIDENTRLALIDIDTGQPVAASIDHAGAASLLAMPSGWIVIARDAVFRQQGAEWTQTPLIDEARHFGVIVSTATADGSIYIGYNQGEWGGGLWRIAPGGDVVQEITRIDGDEVCDGPLSATCQPVTGLIADPSGPDCVIAATGLSHMLAQGAVMRVCGEQVEVLFQEVIPQAEGSFGAGLNTWPMFGLIQAPRGWAAVSADKLFTSRDGAVLASDMPTINSWHGLGLGEGEGFLVLRTDVNWGMSLSGYTPMLVSVTP